MRVRNPALQIALIVVAAAAIAIVANAFAGRQRRLVLPGYYPNALRVPPRQPEVVPAPPVLTTATTAPVAVTATVPAMTTTTNTTNTTTTTSTTSTTPTSPIRPTSPISPTTTTTTTAPPPANPLARFTPHPDKAYIEISGDDAAALYKNGALFLDARRTSVYEEGHIAGARSFSVWESDIDDKVNALFNERDDPAKQDLPIVVYCSGGACEDSHMLSQKLWGIQFNNVYVYKDGFPDWQKRGGAVRTGGNP